MHIYIYIYIYIYIFILTESEPETGTLSIIENININRMYTHKTECEGHKWNRKYTHTGKYIYVVQKG
jgi:hypothetical protein